MCLKVDGDVQDRFLKKLEREGEVTCYKVVRKHVSGQFTTPYRSTSVYLNRLFKAFLRPNEKKFMQKSKYVTGNSIFKGIHVYLTRADARDHARHSSILKIVKVKCKKENFVAAGMFSHRKSAVFTEVFVTDEVVR